MVSLVLRDVQGLFGGQDLWLFADGSLIVQIAKRPGTKDSTFRYTTKLDAKEIAAIEDLLKKHNFEQIIIPERFGVPDEAQPAITLTTSGKTTTVKKWANDKNADFDAVYKHLLALVKTAQKNKPDYNGAYDGKWEPTAPAATTTTAPVTQPK